MSDDGTWSDESDWELTDEGVEDLADIDGGLIGGASLESGDFLAIARA